MNASQLTNTPAYLFLVLLSLVAACNSSGSKKTDAQNVPPPVNEYPNVLLLDADGKQFSAKDLDGGGILIFFSSSCDHCQREAKDIGQHLDGFKDYHLYFIATDPFNEMEQFANDYGVSGKSNISFLRTDGASVTKALGSINTPTILVYSHDKRLRARFDGETSAVSIVEHL